VDSDDYVCGIKGEVVNAIRPGNVLVNCQAGTVIILVKAVPADVSNILKRDTADNSMRRWHKIAPNLKPFPFPLKDPEPHTLLPLRNAQQFSMSTGLIAIHKSQPSSEFSQARQPRNTLPGPMNHFAANPSAFPPIGGS